MKKLISLIIGMIILGLSHSFSQTVNDIPINEIDVEYIQIVGTGNFRSGKVKVRLDFGNENKYLSSKETRIKDENGELLEFNSMVDALNFFGKNGYEFIEAYSLSFEYNECYFMLKKRDIQR
ncbi:hypothetical protein M3O96_16175 [Aquiflexum sp. TKW24L]|uniref:hypothetical protein n=1 Tax=Aquiflexum sp. TKW24L TaxID=2942212 RepID=UPI0020BE2730|nr:hypothetical protein [Aquiflexum sp. TKW24L]MCL6260642.1 hypothetical protein [Aquiflexum sp. TKW24L]